MTEREIRRLGLPWSEALVSRSRFSVAGTIAAARAALSEGVAANLGGGTHHALADHGEGFCVLNDIAVAIRLLRAEGLIRRAAVIDCDVHQGNGTAHIFADDPEVFTLSLFFMAKRITRSSNSRAHLTWGLRIERMIKNISMRSRSPCQRPSSDFART